MRRLAAVLALALASPAALHGQDTLASRLQACASVEDDAERLACYDALAADLVTDDRWVVVGEWAGSGPKATESFAVPVGEWRVRWESGPDGYLSIQVRTSADDPVATVANHTGEGSDVSYVRAEPGRFYLDVNAANVEWRVVVEVPPGQ